MSRPVSSNSAYPSSAGNTGNIASRLLIAAIIIVATLLLGLKVLLSDIYHTQRAALEQQRLQWESHVGRVAQMVNLALQRQRNPITDRVLTLLPGTVVADQTRYPLAAGGWCTMVCVRTPDGLVISGIDRGAGWVSWTLKLPAMPDALIHPTRWSQTDWGEVLAASVVGVATLGGLVFALIALLEPNARELAAILASLFSATAFIMIVLAPPRLRDWFDMATMPWLAGPASLLAVSLYLWRRHGKGTAQDHRPRCGCGYDLTGNLSGVCPECGRQTSLVSTPV